MSPISRIFSCFFLSISCLAALCLSAASVAQAERPTAPQLLPRSTSLVFRIADAPELRNKFLKTVAGRMSQDPQLKPLLDQLYGEAVKAFDFVEQQIGVSLPDLLAIPQGELTIAVVAPEGELPAVVVLLDTGDKIESAQKLIDQATTLMDQGGLTKNVETIDETEIISYALPGTGAGEATFFQRDNTVVVCNRLKLAQQILNHWGGVENTDDLLAKNAKYAAIMKKCRRSKKNPPQITFFVDPIALAQSALTGNFAGQTGLAILPAIGLDGFSGVGGSITFDAEPFDVITQLHLLLENPRTGALKLLALGEGETTPQAWVPADVASYSTIHWDFKKTFEQIGELVDSFQGGGAFAALIEKKLNQQLGIDVEKDLINGLAGRVTYLNWYQRPIKLTSSSNLLAIELNDPEAMQKTIDLLIEKIPAGDPPEKITFGKVTYYKFSGKQPPPQGSGVISVGTQAVVLGIMDNVLLLSDHESLLKKVVTSSADPEKSLAGAEDYKTIARRFERIAGKNKPGMVTYNQPEEGMRFLYELATSAETQEFLAGQSKESQFFRTLKEALEKNPLPPFAVISKYLAPSGGLLVNEETGFHYTGFTLRRE